MKRIVGTGSPQLSDSGQRPQLSDSGQRPQLSDTAGTAQDKPGWRRCDVLEYEPRRYADGWRCELDTSLRHPYYFDHPQDHVPGMLQLCAVLDLTDALVDIERPGMRLTMALSFPKLCELRQATTISAVPGLDGTWAVRVVQDGPGTVCDGWVDYLVDEPPAVPAAPWALPDRSRPCAAELVHRARSENIMLGQPHEHGDRISAAVLPPPAGHVLARSDGGYSAQCLVEAGLQFTMLLLHRAGGHPLGCQMIWLDMEADVPCVIGGNLPLTLRWRTEPLRGATARLRLDVYGPDQQAPALGTLRYGVVAVSAMAYRRYRRSAGGS